jgi:hypothetical protein
LESKEEDSRIMLSKSSITQEHSSGMAGFRRTVRYTTWNNPELGIMAQVMEPEVRDTRLPASRSEAVLNIPDVPAIPIAENIA